MLRRFRRRRFWRRPRREKLLYLWAFLLTVGTRGALRVLPFQKILRVADRAQPARHGLHRPLGRGQIVRAVRASARRLLRDKPCLTQAPVVLFLFRRNGHPATLRIGVQKGEADALEAHAWIESDGVLMIGHLPNLSDYTALPPLEAAATHALLTETHPA